jgi:prophage regulatory protein
MLHTKPIQFDYLPDSAFIRLNQMINTRLTPFSASTVWRKVKCGEFPPPIKLSGNITAWQVGDIRSWQSRYRPTQNASASSWGDA